MDINRIFKRGIFENYRLRGAAEKNEGLQPICQMCYQTHFFKSRFPNPKSTLTLFSIPKIREDLQLLPNFCYI